MLPKILGVVRLTRDVELKYLPSGSAVAQLGLACSKKYKTQSGEQKEDVCFLNASIFGKLAEVANSYLKKGSQIYIDGEEVTEQWQKDGQNKSAQKVRINSFEMLDKKPDNQGQNQQSYSQPQQNAQQQYTPPQNQQQMPTIDMDSEEIPF